MYLKYGCAVILLTIFLTACTNKQQLQSEIISSNYSITQETTFSQETMSQEGLFRLADNSKDCTKMVQESYSPKDIFQNSGIGLYFSARAHSGYHETIDSVNEKLKIECLRYKDNGDYYAVYLPKEGGRVYTFFSKEDNYLLSHSLYQCEPLDMSAFQRLKKGDTFADVLAIDPAIRKCLAQGVLCNLFSTGDYDYTVHMFYDKILLIVYNRNPNAETPNQITIDRLQWFDNGQINLDKPNSLICGTYDYTILPQDYIQ